MQARRLKVAPLYRSCHPQQRITSQLRIQGNWLAAAGFPPGTVAAIVVQAGRLIITPAPVQ